MSKTLRHMMRRGRLFALRCCMFLITLMGLCAPLLADQAQYIYGDLGRLSQVLDGQGNVATYNYDAVGNLLSITRNTGGVGEPTITGLTPNTGNPAVASALVSGISISPVAFKTIRVGLRDGVVRPLWQWPTHHA